MLTFFYCVGRALRSRDRGSAVACRASQTGNLCLCCLRCLFICEASSHTHQPVSATIVQKEEGERKSVFCCCVYVRREETPAHVVQLKLEERRRQRRENLLTFRNTFRFTQSREKRARRRTFSFRAKGRPMRAQLSLHRQRCRHSYTARKVNEMSNFNLSIELHDIPWNEFHTTTSIHSVEARTCSETTSRSKQKQK